MVLVEKIRNEALLPIKIIEGIAIRIGASLNGNDLVLDGAKDSKKRCE